MCLRRETVSGLPVCALASAAAPSICRPRRQRCDARPPARRPAAAKGPRGAAGGAAALGRLSSRTYRPPTPPPPSRRHFATRQFRSDLFGTCIGSLIYLSLTRPLAEAHRPDLAAAALFCAGVCLWPAALARWAPRFYAARRDFILLLHFLFHYWWVWGWRRRRRRLRRLAAAESETHVLNAVLHPSFPSSSPQTSSLGGQLGRIVRLNAKWQAASPAAFLASYILSSTLLWQGLDAMM